MNNRTVIDNKYRRYINNWPAIISALAALISAFMAYVSYTNNKAFSVASLSLKEFKINVDKVVPDKNELKIRFSFVLENIGKEPIQINEIKILHVDIDHKKALQVYDQSQFLNTINSGAVFTHNIFQSFVLADLKERDKDNFIEMMGDHAFIIHINYLGKSYKEKKNDLYYLKFNGRPSMLSYEEYLNIFEILPEEYRIKIIKEWLTNKDRSCERSEPRSYPVLEQARQWLS